MADRVEAELESPEASSIAREDVLLRKMDEERERWEVGFRIAVLRRQRPFRFIFRYSCGSPLRLFPQARAARYRSIHALR